MTPKIALLLSGGVDSAVALHQLISDGQRPDCFYIRIAPTEDADDTLDCSAEEDIEIAQALCHRYGVSLEVIDCHKEYWERVTRYTIEKVRQGFTPNPDVMCNRLVKFGAFHEKRGHAYDLIATGHYARTEEENISDSKTVTDEASQSGVRKLKWLCTSPDPVKDQTDFLAQLYDWQLSKALFPIGHMTKEEVRHIAEQEHLINARRKDSQGICFLGKINYNDYIRRYLGEKPGLVIDIETGKKIGMHKGLWFHTIGQRHGLGFGGGPWFAVKKNIKKNILLVSRGYNPQSAYTQTFRIGDLHMLTVPVTELLSPDSPYYLPEQRITFKIRHTSDFLPATISANGDNTYTIHADAPIHGVAPGQFCVIYDHNHHRCYGSGEIIPN
ncbi:MAG: tRNA 2-thiouridine(34) synthase MnmA [Prevotella sp.]|nr:tRNA 2-thiouridine(34) synthase MnmA [Prevotella sp.]